MSQPVPPGAPARLRVLAPTRWLGRSRVAGRLLAVALACAGFAHGASADPVTAGALSLTNIRAFATPPGAMAGAGYLTIDNGGTSDDRLIAVEADVPRVMIHTTVMEDGIARMRHVDGGVEIPAGGQALLQPGGLHVMFMGLRNTPLVAGETLPATLIFEKAGAVPVIFDIVPRSTSGAGHTDHDSSTDHDSHGGHGTN